MYLLRGLEYIYPQTRDLVSYRQVSIFHQIPPKPSLSLVMPGSSHCVHLCDIEGSSI